jgi:glycosyltransferase involved in cell wall biosynthesis
MGRVMNSLTVIIPCFNEDRTVNQLINSLSSLDNSNTEIGTIKFIFIDDGSSDNTRFYLEESLSKSSLEYTLISNDINQGKSASVLNALKILKTTHFLVFDADLEIEVSDILKLWKIVLYKKSDFVFGYRTFLSHSSFSYNYTLGNKLVSNLYGFLYNQVITDVLCGMKLLPTSFAKNLNTNTRNFCLEAEIAIKMYKYSYIPYEIPISYRARSRLQGKTISIKDALDIVLKIILNRIITRRNKNSKKSFFVNLETSSE